MKHRANTPRLVILACLPATQAEIHTKTGVSQAAVSRWLVELRKCNEAHISAWRPASVKGGYPAAIYSPGPGADVANPSGIVLTSDEVHRRANQPKPVRWRIPRRDPLTAALFGAARP